MKKIKSHLFLLSFPPGTNYHEFPSLLFSRHLLQTDTSVKYNKAIYFTKDPMLGCHSHVGVNDSKCLLSVSVSSCRCPVPVHSSHTLRGAVLWGGFIWFQVPLFVTRMKLFLRMKLLGNSLAVQWLELGTFTAGARVQSLVGELR